MYLVPFDIILVPPICGAFKVINTDIRMMELTIGPWVCEIHKMGSLTTGIRYRTP